MYGLALVCERSTSVRADRLDLGARSAITASAFPRSSVSLAAGKSGDRYAWWASSQNTLSKLLEILLLFCCQTGRSAVFPVRVASCMVVPSASEYQALSSRRASIFVLSPLASQSSQSQTVSLSGRCTTRPLASRTQMFM